MKGIIVTLSGMLIGILAQLSYADSFMLELDVNTGYNNNVFLESDDLVVNEASEDSHNNDIQTQMAVTANYEFWDQENSDASIMVDYFKETLMENDLDTTVKTISIPTHYYKDTHRYGLTFTRQTYNLSGVDVLAYRIAKIGFAKNLGLDKLYVSLTGTDKSPKDESYAEYDGSSRALSVKYKGFIGMASGEKWTVKGNVFSNDYEGEGLSNTGGYIKAVYEITRGRHSMSLGAKVKRTQYELDTLTNDERIDRQSTVNYHHEYYLSPATQLYLDTSYIKNQSNIDYADENYNYDQWIQSFGARFVF